MGVFTSTLGQFKQTPNINLQQQQALSQILQQGLGGMQDPYKGFEPIEQQARSQWQSNTLPSLIEQFTAGSPSGERSSAFAGALGGAGADLEQGLASQRSQYGLQQQGLSKNLLGLGMQSPFETAYQPEQQSMLMQLLMAYIGSKGGSQSIDKGLTYGANKIGSMFS